MALAYGSPTYTRHTFRRDGGVIFRVGDRRFGKDRVCRLEGILEPHSVRGRYSRCSLVAYKVESIVDLLVKLEFLPEVISRFGGIAVHSFVSNLGVGTCADVSGRIRRLRYPRGRYRYHR